MSEGDEKRAKAKSKQLVHTARTSQGANYPPPLQSPIPLLARANLSVLVLTYLVQFLQHLQYW